MIIPPLFPCASTFLGMRCCPLQAQTPEIDLGEMMNELVEYKDQSSLMKQMIKDQKLQSIDRDGLDALLQTYQTNVQSFNQLRNQFEQLKKADPKDEEAIKEMQAKLDDIWGSIVLTELFFANTASETKPFPLAQYLFSQIYPSGSDFARKTGALAHEHKEHDGWVAIVLQPKEEQIVVEWINNNEMGKVTQHVPVIIINAFNDIIPEKFEGKKGQYVEDYIKRNVNWKTVEERLRSAVSDSTKKKVDEMITKSQQ